MDSRATERMKRLAVGGRGWRTGEHACFGVWPAGMSWAVQSSNRPDFALVSPTRALTCWPGLPLYSIGLAPVPQREFCPSGNKPFGGGLAVPRPIAPTSATVSCSSKQSCVWGNISFASDPPPLARVY